MKKLLVILSLFSSCNMATGQIPTRFVGRVVSTYSVAQTPPAPGATWRVLVDVGTGTATTSPQGAVYWNNIADMDSVASSDNGTKCTAMVDTANISRAIKIVSYDQWVSTLTPAINTTGATAAVGEYPQSATGDGAYVHYDSTLPRRWEITLPAGSYTMKVWGSRNTGADTRGLMMKLHGDATYQYVTQAGNTDYNHALYFALTSDGSTPIRFDIAAYGSSGGTSTYGYMDVLDIRRTGD